MKSLRALILSIVAVTGLGAACSDTETLKVNKSLEHYTIEKSREEGERDLVRLARHTKEEEAFIFVKYKDGREIWYEWGIDEEYGGVNHDYAVLDDILAESDKRRLTVGHPHTPPNNEHDAGQTFSGCDIRRSSVAILEYVRERDPNLLNKIDFEVFTSTGFYLIEFDAEIFDDRLKMDRVRALVFDVGIARGEIEIGRSREFDYSIYNKKNFVKLNKKFAKKFSNEMVNIIFYEVE